MHVWDVWNQRDYTAYREYRPRFVAEFGFQGPPTWSTLTRARPRRPADARTRPAMLHHQKARTATASWTAGWRRTCPAPADFDEWHYLTQLNQARAVRLGVEHFRSPEPLLPGRGRVAAQRLLAGHLLGGRRRRRRRKPLWYAVRHAFASRLLTIQPRDGRPAVVLVNDGDQPWAGTLDVSRWAVEGPLLARASMAFEVAGGGTTQLALGAELAVPARPDGELLVAESAGLQAIWCYVEDRDLQLDPVPAQVAVEQRVNGVDLVVTARGLVRGLVCQADRLDPDAETDDQDLTVLPGRTAVLRVRTSVPADDPRWTSRPVLWSLNSLRLL